VQLRLTEEEAMNLVILAAVAIQWFVSMKNRLWGAILGLLITLGIGIWGIGLYMDGYAVTFFGFTLSQGIFLLLVVAWIVYDVVLIVQAKNLKPDITLAEDTNIYTDCDLNAAIVRTAPKGDILKMKPPVKNVKGTQWMPLVTADGTKQYILGNTPVIRKFNISQKETKVYAQPDRNSEVLQVIEGQQQIELGKTETFNNEVWVKVSTREIPEGYILGSTRGKVVKS
jgi:hypothetical protein